MSEPSRPRTTEERMAYEAGYAAAVNDINDHGLRFASEQVRLMAEAETLMKEKA